MRLNLSNLLRWVPAPVLVMLAWSLTPVAADGAELTVEQGDTRVRVLIDGELFTEYLYGPEVNNPVLYPVIGPSGVGMTRNWPLVEGVAGEANDHPHHRSLWYAHGAVNGVDFWTDRQGAKILPRELLAAESHGNTVVIRSSNDWMTSAGQTLLSDERTLVFSVEGGARQIDYTVELKASHGEVTLGDTKEGSMAIRTNSRLRLKADPNHGVTEVSGHAVNSEGVEGRELWGKHAAWVDYWGELPAADGEGRVTAGVAIFDHPSNPRHPTTWHARDYGLVAANPFGLSDFEEAPRGTGDLKLAEGESVRFSYRFVFHDGDAEAARVAERFAEYAKTTPGAP